MSRRRPTKEIVRDTLDFDNDSALPGYRCVRPAHVMPLWEFAPPHRARIEAAVLEPRPPDKWLKFELCQMVSRAWAEWHWQRGIDPFANFDGRSSLSPNVRAYVMERDEMVCGLCGYFVDEKDCHIDHIHPWSLGGSDDLSNLQVSHARCNMRKGAKV